MANYSRDEMEENGEKKIGIGIAALGILGAIIGGVAASNSQKEQERALAQQRAARQEAIDECNQKISDIDSEIANLRSQFMGGFLNSERIEQLQSWRRDWVSRRNELMNS